MKQEINWVDATPDKEYVLRILKSYRELCDCRTEFHGQLFSDNNSIATIMNTLNDQRAALLDIAIKLVEDNLDKFDIFDVCGTLNSFVDPYSMPEK